MTDKEKIRAEIEFRRDYHIDLFQVSKDLEQKEVMHDCDLLVREYQHLLDFIDDLKSEDK